jgi:hypothetical protein
MAFLSGEALRVPVSGFAARRGIREKLPVVSVDR